MVEKCLFAKRTNWELATNPIMKLFKQLRDDGRSIIDLTASNPTQCDFNINSNEMLEVLNNVNNLSYTPDARGLISARESICIYYKEKGIDIRPSQVFLTSSTSEAYSFLFKLLAEPGDRVLFPSPSYPLFQFLVDLNDIEMTHYPLRYNKSWNIDFQEMRSSIEDKTKAVMIVNPNNPTGSYIKDGDIDALNKICGEYRLPLICDEVFLDFCLEDLEPKSLAGNKDNLTFVLSGISKILGMPQMKLSWIIVNGSNGLVEQATDRLEVIADTYLSVSTPVQNAFISWMSKREELQGPIKERISSNLRVLESFVGESERVDLLKVEGGWYVVLKLKNTVSEEEFVMKLLEEKGVFVHPGYFFDFEEGGYIVVSLLPEQEQFSLGCKLLLDYC